MSLKSWVAVAVASFPSIVVILFCCYMVKNDPFHHNGKQSTKGSVYCLTLSSALAESGVLKHTTEHKSASFHKPKIMIEWNCWKIKALPSRNQMNLQAMRWNVLKKLSCDHSSPSLLTFILILLFFCCFLLMKHISFFALFWYKLLYIREILSEKAENINALADVLGFLLALWLMLKLLPPFVLLSSTWCASFCLLCLLLLWLSLLLLLLSLSWLSLSLLSLMLVLLLLQSVLFLVVHPVAITVIVIIAAVTLAGYFDGSILWLSLPLLSSSIEVQVGTYGWSIQGVQFFPECLQWYGIA